MVIMRGLTKRWNTPKASDPRLDLVGRILESRGFENKDARDAFLNPSMKDLEKPSALPGAMDAATLLVEAVKANKRILIFDTLEEAQNFGFKKFTDQLSVETRDTGYTQKINLSEILNKIYPKKYDKK